jgi:hypothetical protein
MRQDRRPTPRGGDQMRGHEHERGDGLQDEDEREGEPIRRPRLARASFQRAEQEQRGEDGGRENE